ncbi:hypothetical protein JKA74_08585 [Marivirga sp. S37H4]|uniref:Uncharacterized protein n=1 Tax=Marivirga aurantiaca TaxID=2802615 RepID=A0A935C8P7_9BACT|nr:hypothetical protein [Marivirga aurantiaca]MBK6265092.1 hypothetical protein [Marivirga aurantiaca]
MRNIEFLINHHKDELKSLKKISENDKGELLKLIEDTFNYFFFGLIFAVSLLFIDKVSNDLFFYGFLGASTTLIIKITRNLIYNYRLIRKSKKIEYHEMKIKKRIKTLKEIIKKSKTE